MKASTINLAKRISNKIDDNKKYTDVERNVKDVVLVLKRRVKDASKKVDDTKKEYLKAKISDKISDIKSKFESKHTKPDHYSPRYVLVRVQPESKYKW